MKRLPHPYISWALRLSVALTAVLWASCNSKNADVKDIPLEWKFVRADKMMYEAAKAAHDSKGKLDTMGIYNQYLKSDRDFFLDLMNLEAQLAMRTRAQRISDGMKDSILAATLVPILAQPAMYQLLDTVQKVFTADYNFEEIITPPLKRLKQEFPQLPTFPAFRTHVSGYPQGDAPSATDQMVPTMSGKYFSFGLHYFLGETYRFYPPTMPKFIRRRCAKDYMEVMFVREIAEGMVEPVDPRKQPTLLDNMVREGIKLALIDKLLPYTPDSLKICYSDKQLAWAEKNEKAVYKELTPQLFSIDFLEHQKYLGEKPYTTHISPESAPRLAQYMGWRIVKAFIEQHPDMKIADLCARTDYETIFKESKYKP